MIATGNSDLTDPNSQTARVDAASLRVETDGIVQTVFARQDLTGLPEMAADPGARRLAEIRFLADTFGLAPERVFALRQVHGVVSHRIGPAALEAPKMKPGVFAEGDALFTAERDAVLMIRTADCLPVFFILRDAAYNPYGFGLIHAGWRGLRDGVIETTLRNACETLGAPARVEVRFGPAIGGASYEVGREVADEFPIVTPRPGRPGKFWLDLIANADARLNAWQRAGAIPVDIMDEMKACTFTANDRFYSHRRGDAERNLNCIVMPNR